VNEAANFADCIERFLDLFGRWRERDEVNKMVRKAMGEPSLKMVGPITINQYLVESVVSN